MQHLEFKFAPADIDEKTMTFSGYGAVFGNVDSYGDVIKAGAFSKFLADMQAGEQKRPKMLLQHGGWGMSADDMMPIGVWSELSEDGHGLKVTGQLADTPRGIETYKLMKMGALDAMSIGYIAKEWTPRTKADEPRRTLTRIDLMEISPVTFPANGKAMIEAVKSAPNIRIAEMALRDAGFSRQEAKAIVAEGFKSLSPRDVDDDAIAAVIRRNIAVLS